VTEFTDTGLVTFTWYEYRISSHSGYGAANSTPMVYRTGEDIPSGNFTARVEPVEATAVELSWTAPTSPNGVIQVAYTALALLLTYYTVSQSWS